MLKTQYPRLQSIWTAHWDHLHLALPPLRALPLNKTKFIGDVGYRYKRIHNLMKAFDEGYELIKFLVGSMFGKYIQEGLIFDDFPEEDVLNVCFLMSEKIIGSLLNFISLEPTLVPVGFVITSKYKSLMKLTPVSAAHISKDFEKLGLIISPEDVDGVLQEIVSWGYIQQVPVPASNDNGAGYKFIRGFDLSVESQKKFNLQVKPLIDWIVGLWQSLFDLRALDMELPAEYPDRERVRSYISPAATQGYTNANEVLANLAMLYNPK